MPGTIFETPNCSQILDKVSGENKHSVFHEGKHWPFCYKSEVLESDMVFNETWGN